MAPDSATRQWKKFAADCKLVGDALQPFVIIVAGIFALVTYVVSEQDIREDRRVELRRPYDEKQLELYVEAAKVASHLAIAPREEPAERAAVEARFWELYWGELAFVESDAIESMMVAVCEHYVSPDKTTRCHKEASPFAAAALDLAHQGSDEIRARWIR